jgi:hypothetical protein
MLGQLRHVWAPESFMVSFKLETDESILVKKVSSGMILAANTKLHFAEVQLLFVWDAACCFLACLIRRQVLNDVVF